jgi:hypothetical protein
VVVQLQPGGDRDYNVANTVWPSGDGLIPQSVYLGYNLISWLPGEISVEVTYF